MASEAEEGGFDVEFVDPLPDDLVCIMCHLALRDPVQIACCGHRFCSVCFNKFVSYSKQHGTDLVCPLDRNRVEMHQVFSDIAASRAVLGLMVRCAKHASGCDWVGELRDRQDHFEKSCSQKKSSSSAMESGMRELALRVEECERCMLSQSKLISSLQETLREKDTKIDALQNSMRELTRKNGSDTESLRNQLQALKGGKMVQNALEGSLQQAIKIHEQRLNYTETRLQALETLNPTMGSFEWFLNNYEERRDGMDTVKSPSFRSSLNGHMCCLAVQWFDRRKSRLGVFFNVLRDENQSVKIPFRRKVVIACVGKQGMHKTCVFTDFCPNGDTDGEEDVDAHDEGETDNEDDAQNVGDAYFLSQPDLDKFVVDNCMHFVCYLS